MTGDTSNIIRCVPLNPCNSVTAMNRRASFEIPRQQALILTSTCKTGTH